MIYVREGHKKDMWFVCKDAIEDYEILRVFYSKDKADSYVKENQRIR